MWGNKRAVISLPPLAAQNRGALTLVYELVDLTSAVAERTIAHADHRQVGQSPGRVVPDPVSGHVQSHILLPFLAKTEKDRRHLLLREGFKSLLDDGGRLAARMAAQKEERQ